MPQGHAMRITGDGRPANILIDDARVNYEAEINHMQSYYFIEHTIQQ